MRQLQRLSVSDHPQYHRAHEVLESVLQRDAPPPHLLSHLYGLDLAPRIHELITNFLSEEFTNPVTPRKHNLDAPTEIGDTRARLEYDARYQAVQTELLQHRIPDRVMLQNCYGEYAEAVRQIFDLFRHHMLMRKCGIPSVAHLNRVGSMAGALGLDKNEGDKKYSAIGAMHDAIEDLLNLAVDDTGRGFGLARYEEFIDEFIPDELQSSLVLLTNHYDLILGHIQRDLRRKDRALTRNHLVSSLEQLASARYPGLDTYIKAMLNLLSAAELEPDVYENAKWRCYRNLYIHDMAAEAHAVANYRTYQTKALDIADNANGREALAMAGRIKNILKMDIWGREGYALGSSWPPLNNHVIEFEETALMHAEQLVIRDFLEPVLTQDFIMSGLQKIKALRPVFFVDELQATATTPLMT